MDLDYSIVRLSSTVSIDSISMCIRDTPCTGHDLLPHYEHTVRDRGRYIFTEVSVTIRSAWEQNAV